MFIEITTRNKEISGMQNTLVIAKSDFVINTEIILARISFIDSTLGYGICAIHPILTGHADYHNLLLIRSQKASSLEKLIASAVDFNSGIQQEIEEYEIRGNEIAAEKESLALTIRQLMDANVERANLWHGEGGIMNWPESEWANALNGEVGELANIIKQRTRLRQGLIGNKNDATMDDLLDAAGDELADIGMYWVILAARLGIDLECHLRRKFNEVSERFGFEGRL